MNEIIIDFILKITAIIFKNTEFRFPCFPQICKSFVDKNDSIRITRKKALLLLVIICCIGPFRVCGLTAKKEWKILISKVCLC